MKCLFALVLLHLCHGATVNRTLNTEMLSSLDQLSNLSRNRSSNFTVPTVASPGNYMRENPISCLGAFTTALRNLLDSLTVDTVGQVLILKLRGNLRALGEHPQCDANCTTVQRKSTAVFRQYRTFLQKLNSKG